MNRFNGVGTLPRAAILNGGEKKVLRFTLRTILGHNNKTNKDRLAFVPCVVFKPTQTLVQMLTEHFDGMTISLEGRVNTSKFETKDGQTKYSTEVIVDQTSIKPVDLHVPVTKEGQKAA
jgi:single-stranded DNA-binding protein